MNRKIAPFIDIVRLEDKETKLKSFVRNVVDQSQVRCGTNEAANGVLLIARSIDSPVAKAVAALVREGAITTPVKLILALPPRQEVEGDNSHETFSALTGSNGGRIIRDIRLFDAHEQLVLGPTASWVGDCMRRDPMKRDAYECYAADCGKTAGWAKTSFDRMWETCEPMPDDQFQHAKPADPEVCLPAVAAEETANDPLTPSSN
jgi:hypothetical protein